MLFKPRLIALDSSHLGGWIRDYHTNDADARTAARRFERWLEENGYIVLVCLHHFGELLRHENESIALTRARFIRGRRILAWIGTPAEVGPGSVVTMLAEEARAAMELPGAHALEVRDLAASRLVQFGTGEGAIGPSPERWLALRPALNAQSEKAREVMAIGRSPVIDIRDMRISDLMNGRVRSGEALRRRLDLIGGSIATDIERRGDKNIADPSAMANNFMNDVQEIAQQAPQNAYELILYCLSKGGVISSDIETKSTVGDMLDLAMFRSQLRTAAGAASLSFEDMVENIRMDQIPSWIISDSLRRYAQDLPERKGSELNDGHLACLSAYADVTFVDKRTRENFQRALGKVPLLAQLVQRVERAASYRDIPEILTPS